jgi:hypothetical protein
MKLIARTLVILAAALLVCGATFVLGSTSAAQALFPARRGREVVSEQRPAEIGPGPVDSAGTAPPGTGRRGPGGSRGRGGFAMLEVLQSLAIVAVIVAVVAPVLRVTRRRTKAPSQPPAARDTPLAAE